jgi:hypothetical protein
MQARGLQERKQMLSLELWGGIIIGAAVSGIYFWIVVTAREVDTEAEFRKLQRALKEAQNDH